MVTHHNPHFGQVITAMITPFSEQGEVDYAVAEKLAIHLVENGSDALVISGTTGESPTLSPAEKLKLFEVTKAAVGNSAKIIAGTGSNSTQTAVELTRAAAGLGVDGTLQVAPYYNKPPQASLIAHFSAIANECPDIPMMLYNVPGRTGVNIQPETTAQLSDLDNIIAIKEASGDIEQTSQIRQLCRQDFLIYSGEDALTLPLLSIGAVGVVSVASHLAGPSIKRMIQAFFEQDVLEAEDYHRKLYPLFKELFCQTNPIPIRAALELKGWSIGIPRLPLLPLALERKTALKNTLQDWL